jgi:hypothetical protein
LNQYTFITYTPLVWMNIVEPVNKTVGAPFAYVRLVYQEKMSSALRSGQSALLLAADARRHGSLRGYRTNPSRGS